MRAGVLFGIVALCGVALCGVARADYVPSGPDALPRLLGPDAFEDVSRSEVARTVEKQGFWAGDAIGVSQCATCHPDAAAQWSSSAHRFASFNNPYYTASVEAFRKERGEKESRFCANCHDPALVLSGRIDHEIDKRTREAQAGIVCLTCHSIADHPARTGNGRFVAKLDAWPTSGPGHKARLRPAVMESGDFCGTCHRVGLTEDVTHARWFRGQDDLYPWLASSISGQGAGSIHRASPPGTVAARCQDCHMQREPAVLGDAAAKTVNGVRTIMSHRFLGANAALPHLRGDDEQEARVRAFLKDRVSLDVVEASPGIVDVVLRSRGVGHRFPSGTMDSNEVWVDVVAFDDKGATLGESGALHDGALGKEAHLVRAQPVDERGVPLAARDAQHTRGTVYDNSLVPGDPQAVRYALPPGTTRITATLRYRKLDAQYVRFACAVIPDADVRVRCESPPVIDMAQTSIEVHGAPFVCGNEPYERTLDHGIALAAALSDRADEARTWLACAQSMKPRAIEPVLGLQRLALVLGQTDELVALAKQARAIDTTYPAADYVLAMGLLKAYRPAIEPAERLGKRLPHDPAVMGLLARARGLAGDAHGALKASDALLAIDPESEEGHYQRALALRELHRDDEAEHEQQLYLRHRTATEDNLALRALWRVWTGQPHDESEPLHVHALQAERAGTAHASN